MTEWLGRRRGREGLCADGTDAVDETRKGKDGDALSRAAGFAVFLSARPSDVKGGKGAGASEKVRSPAVLDEPVKEEGGWEGKVMVIRGVLGLASGEGPLEVGRCHNR